MIPRLPSLPSLLVPLLILAAPPALANGPQPAAASAAMPEDGTRAYVIKRNDSPIGTLAITFARTGDRLVVESRHEVKVEFALVVVYRYEKTMRETWEDGRLVAYETAINDNGTASEVSVARSGDTLTVTHPKGREVVPLGTMVSSYWPPATVRQTTLIDSSDGLPLKVAVSAPVAEDLAIDGRTVKALRYRMTGDLERDLWYADDGAWLKMKLTARDGSVVEIERDWEPVWKRGLL